MALFYFSGLFTVIEQVFNVKIRVMNDSISYLTLGDPFINNTVVFTIVILIIFISHFTYKYIEIKGQQLNIKYGDKSRSKVAR